MVLRHYLRGVEGDDRKEDDAAEDVKRIEAGRKRKARGRVAP